MNRMRNDLIGGPRATQPGVMLGRLAIGSLVILTAVSSAGCFERALRPLNPCTRSTFDSEVNVENVDKVDLLFMIDNSNSMGEEQEAIIDQIPRLVELLASGGTSDDDDDNFGPDRMPGTADDGQPHEGNVANFPPVQSLHIGVVSSDMGTGIYQAPRCGAGVGPLGSGDDGILLRRRAQTRPPVNDPNYNWENCFPPDGLAPSSIFDFDPSTDNVATYAGQVTCAAVQGTGGCGFEQQLEAVLKALSPAAPTMWTVDGYVPPTFIGSEPRGHAGPGGLNDGFIRPDSALAIIMATDEEDCSVINPQIFESPAQPGNPFGPIAENLRCFFAATDPDPNINVVYPIDRYTTGGGAAGGRGGLLGLRRNPTLLIFAAIVGVPTDLVSPNGQCDPLAQRNCPEGFTCVADPDPNPGDNIRPGHCEDPSGTPVSRTNAGVNFDEILADQRMLEMQDPTDPLRLLPSCDDTTPTSAPRHLAFPPRRIVSVASEIARRQREFLNRPNDPDAGSAIVQSICQDDYTAALNAVIEKISQALGGTCLPRPLNTDENGLVNCDVYEIQPEGVTIAMEPCSEVGRVQGSEEEVEVTVNGELVTRVRCTMTQIGIERARNPDPVLDQGWTYERASDPLIPRSGVSSGACTTTADCTGDRFCIRGECRQADILQRCQTGQRITFVGSAEAQPQTGRTVQLQCVQNILGGSDDTSCDATDPLCQIGFFCDPEAAAPAGVTGSGSVPADVCTRNNDTNTIVDETRLRCDPATRTCGIACTATSDCTGAGRLGEVCDIRSWRETVALDQMPCGQPLSAAERMRRERRVPRTTTQVSDPPSEMELAAPHNFCVNATCVENVQDDETNCDMGP